MSSPVWLQQSICEKIHHGTSVLHCTHIPIYWLTSMSATRRLKNTYVRTRTHTLCPVSVHSSFSSILSPLLGLYKPVLHFTPPPSLPAATNRRKPERTEGGIRKEGKRKTAKRKGEKGEKVLVGVSLSSTLTKDQWASTSGLPVNTGPKNEQPAV